MHEIVLATHNGDKISEILQVLGKLPIIILTFENLRGLPSVVEDGRSLYENAFKKALIISTYTGKIALADDSGLEVDFLNGEPGVYSSRFSGPGATYSSNNKKLLELLQGVPPEKRIARFVCVMVLYFPGGSSKTFKGVLNGKITTAPRGENGFGYDPIFFIPKLGKTLAELSREEKNKISHRGKALKKVYEFLNRYFVE